MKLFKIVFWVLWRIWFYILIMVPIIFLFPILFVLVISDKTYPQFYRVARFWGKIILYGMGFYYKIDFEEPLEKGKSYMFVANHTSMTDVMLMLAVVKDNPFVFVGKKELVKIPIFGFFYKRVCILVDRKSSKSRYKVFELAQERLRQGLSICIFPEGGVPDDESIVLDTFKDGAFRLAIEHEIAVIPITFADNKKRFSFTFLSGSPGKMRVKVHKAVVTQNLVLEDKVKIKEQVRTIILEQLTVYNN